ncbi:MAG: hypothetical protein ACOX0J_00795 [Thermoactinomyces vulgaris]
MFIFGCFFVAFHANMQNPGEHFCFIFIYLSSLAQICKIPSIISNFVSICNVRNRFINYSQEDADWFQWLKHRKILGGVAYVEGAG